MLLLIFQLDTLKVGDILQINIIGYDYETKTIIDNNGYALIQPFGYFKLANLDLLSAQDSILEKIRDIYPLAKVSISILNKMLPKVYILTNRDISAVIDYQRGMNIKFVLFSSGKFSEDKIERIILIRNGKGQAIKKDQYDVEVLPNDIIRIDLKEDFPWQNLLTLINVITSSLTLLILLGVISPR